MLEKTYEMETSPTQAMSWSEYEAIVRSRFDTLLSSGASELEMQFFFESHPCMVPGAFDLLGGSSGHLPFPIALISQPVLPSYNYKKPDFVWFSTNSMEFTPISIEIEAPTKRWFTKSKQPTADLNHSIQQLRDWKIWFDTPQNREAFFAYYRIPSYLKERRFLPRFALIYGRRSEFEGDTRLASVRSHLQSHNEIFMTYDRIFPEEKSKNIMCVKVDDEGYRAISIPPTLRLRPGYAEAWVIIRDRNKAVKASELIPDDRKEFLVRRFAYWDEWLRQRSRHIGIISPGDFE